MGVTYFGADPKLAVAEGQTPGNTSSAVASVVPTSTGDTQLGSVPGASAHFSPAASTHVVLGRHRQLPGDFSAGSGLRAQTGGQAGRQAAAARLLGCKGRSGAPEKSTHLVLGGKRDG